MTTGNWRTRPDRPEFAPPFGYYTSARGEVAALVPTEVQGVLDVGCGSGGFLEELRRQRPDLALVGVELEEEPARAALDKGLDVRHGAFPEAAEGIPGSIDCVVFNDVLEHLPDPWAALEHARSIVGRDGWVIASLPNLRNVETLRQLLFEGEFRYRHSGVLDVTHLRFYTFSSASRTLDEVGWNVVEVVPVGRITSRKLVWTATVASVVAPWLRREGIFRQFVVIARSR